MPMDKDPDGERPPTFPTEQAALTEGLPMFVERSPNDLTAVAGDNPWWLTEEPKPRKKSDWPKRANGSPYKVKLAQTCMRKFTWRYNDRRPDPSGPFAIVGKLVHGTYQDAAIRRLNRTRSIPSVASVDELLFLLNFQTAQLANEGEPESVAPQMLDEARKLIRDFGPLELRFLYATEITITLQVTHSLLIGGRIDRVDLVGDPNNPDIVVIYDYKTTLTLMDDDDLWYEPQFGLYLAWARRRWPNAREIQFKLVNTRFAKAKTLYWTQALDDYHLAAAASAYALWRSGSTKATVGEHCKYCPFRDGDEKFPPCKAYQDELARTRYLEKPETEKADAAGGLDALSLPQLLRLYRSSQQAEKLHEERKSDLKAAILRKLGNQTKFSYGDLSASVTRDRVRAYDAPWRLLNELSRISGVAPDLLLQDLFEPRVTRLDEWVEGLDEEKREKAEIQLERYQTLAQKKPKLTVRRNAAMF